MKSYWIIIWELMNDSTTTTRWVLAGVIPVKKRKDVQKQMEFLTFVGCYKYIVQLIMYLSEINDYE